MGDIQGDRPRRDLLADALTVLIVLSTIAELVCRGIGWALKAVLGLVVIVGLILFGMSRTGRVAEFASRPK